MFTLIVENEYNQQLELTHNPAYTITGIDGLNPPEAIINTTYRAGHDGSMFNSAYLDNRLITLTLAINYPAERNRNELYKYFRGGKKTRLHYINGLHDVYIDGYVQTAPVDFFAEKEIFQVGLLCPDPYFYDTSDGYATNEQVTNNFSFPFSIEEEGMVFGSIENGSGLAIENRGQVEVGALFQLTATSAYASPRITNADTGEYFGVGTTLEAGDVLTIDTTTDGKRVEKTHEGVTQSIAGLIADGSSWLVCRPGLNLFTVSGSGDIRGILATVTIRNKYQGV